MVTPAVKLAKWRGGKKGRWEDWVELSHSLRQSFSVWGCGWVLVGEGYEQEGLSYIRTWRPLPLHPGVIQISALSCVLWHGESWVVCSDPLLVIKYCHSRNSPCMSEAIH